MKAPTSIAPQPAFQEVLVIGPGLKEEFKQLEADYKASGLSYHIIGNGERDISRADFKPIHDRIDKNTQLRVFAHGDTQNGKHSMQMAKDEKAPMVSTKQINQEFTKAAGNKDVTGMGVHISSCYGGAAARDATHLPKGAFLTTYSSHNRVEFAPQALQDIRDNIKDHANGVTDPRVAFDRHIARSPETTTITNNPAPGQQPLHFTAHAPNKPVGKEAQTTYLQHQSASYRANLPSTQQDPGLHQNLAANDSARNTNPAYGESAVLLHVARASYDNNPHSRNYVKDYLHNAKKADPNFTPDHIVAPNGLTALEAAAITGSKEMTSTMLKAGAAPNHRDAGGNTCLHKIAGSHSPTTALSTLSKGGADFNARNNQGQTPLDIVVEQGYSDTAKALMKEGANPNLKDAQGYTALHKAVMKGDEGMAKTLLKEGADINQTNAKGNTALHEAAEAGNASMIKLLHDAGARENIRNKEEKTAQNITDDKEAQIAALRADSGPAPSGPAPAPPSQSAPEPEASWRGNSRTSIGHILSHGVDQVKETVSGVKENISGFFKDASHFVEKHNPFSSSPPQTSQTDTAPKGKGRETSPADSGNLRPDATPNISSPGPAVGGNELLTSPAKERQNNTHAQEPQNDRQTTRQSFISEDVKQSDIGNLRPDSGRAEGAKQGQGMDR